MQQNLLGVL